MYNKLTLNQQLYLVREFLIIILKQQNHAYKKTGHGKPISEKTIKYLLKQLVYDGTDTLLKNLYYANAYVNQNEFMVKRISNDQYLFYTKQIHKVDSFKHDKYTCSIENTQMEENPYSVTKFYGPTIDVDDTTFHLDLWNIYYKGNDVENKNNTCPLCGKLITSNYTEHVTSCKKQTTTKLPDTAIHLAELEIELYVLKLTNILSAIRNHIIEHPEYNKEDYHEILSAIDQKLDSK